MSLPERTTGIRLVRRGSGWAVLLLAALAAQIAHVWFRPQGWVYEWRWATYQYQFSTVLLAPLTAGVGAVAGRRWAAARPLLATGARGTTGFALGAAPVLAPVAIAYVAGYAVVIGLVASAGTPGGPAVADLALFLPSLALLGAATSLGYTAGWCTRSLLAAPLASVAVFGGLLAGWVGGPLALVKVGGATASLVGLVQSPTVVTWQTLFYVGLGAAALAVTAAVFRRGGWPAPAAALALTTVAMTPLVRWDGEPLVSIDEPLVCVGEAPQICVAEPYERFVPDLRRRLRPTIDRLDAAGIAAPTVVRQEFWLDVEPGVGSIPPAALVDTDPQSTRFVLVSAWLHGQCRSADEQRAQGDALDAVHRALATGDGDLAAAVTALDSLCRP
jgi:hypothetical protein